MLKLNDVKLPLTQMKKGREEYLYQGNGENSVTEHQVIFLK